MKNKFSLLIFSLSLIAVSLEPFSFAEAKTIQGNVTCKDYYKPTDIVGYFYSAYDHENYYITTDFCVVKALLWYGTIFAPYMITLEDLKKNIDYMFPDPIVYAGLIPGYFLNDGGGRPRRGAFTTEQHFKEKTGYFLNDNPFKHIYGGNYPKPPRYVPDPKMGYGIIEAKGWAALFQQRMASLHEIFANHIVKGHCQIPEWASKFAPTCDYFSARTVPYVPGQFYSFNKLPELKR